MIRTRQFNFYKKYFAKGCQLVAFFVKYVAGFVQFFEIKNTRESNERRN